MTVFKQDNKKSHIEQNCFFGEPVSIARYDIQKYPFIDKLTERQLSFFWRPEEIDLNQDKRDFRDLQFYEQHIFTSNLKRQILLDSVQGRAPTIAFLPICSLPELETWIQTWTFSETIHSRSYTHIIRNVYANPSVIFDEITNIPEILTCATDISKYYDDLIYWNNVKECDSSSYIGNEYEHKKALWKALMSVNILEGIRFYVSFACSWSFAELKKMEGNAKIIKLIARDENIHLAGTQQLLKVLREEDDQFEIIAKETEKESFEMFSNAIEQEKAWAKYLFKDGSIIGLNEVLLSEYIEWIGTKRLQAIGLQSPFKAGSNPLPWTQKWIAGSDVQVAPQEVEISSYTIGSVKQDIEEDTFKGFEL